MGSTHPDVSFLFGLHSASIQIMFRTIYTPSCCLAAVAHIKLSSSVFVSSAYIYINLVSSTIPQQFSGHKMLHNSRAKYYGTKQERHLYLQKNALFLISKCWLRKGIILCNQKLALPCLIFEEKTEKHQRSINSLN